MGGNEKVPTTNAVYRWWPPPPAPPPAFRDRGWDTSKAGSRGGVIGSISQTTPSYLRALLGLRVFFLLVGNLKSFKEMIPYHTTQVEIYKLYSFEYCLASWGLSVIKKNWKKKRVSWVKNSQIRFWYPHFDVTCDLLLNWLNGNVTFPLFVLYNKEAKKLLMVIYTSGLQKIKGKNQSKFMRYPAIYRLVIITKSLDFW